MHFIIWGGMANEVKKKSSLLIGEHKWSPFTSNLEWNWEIENSVIMKWFGVGTDSRIKMVFHSQYYSALCVHTHGKCTYLQFEYYLSIDTIWRNHVLCLVPQIISTAKLGESPEKCNHYKDKKHSKTKFYESRYFNGLHRFKNRGNALYQTLHNIKFTIKSKGRSWRQKTQDSIIYMPTWYKFWITLKSHHR